MSLLATLVVGITFVVSGGIKLNAPQGFAYKIEEYLHVFASQWSKHLRFFLPYTLALAVSIATLEVVLGTALLAHWQAYWTLRVLLLLTLFFSGLTLYTATASRIASCGCFGDAWDLTPWQSFAKSVILLFLIFGLLWSTTTNITTSLEGYYWVVAALVGSLILSSYTIRHLPLLGLGPYKIGSSLAQHTQPHRPLRYLYVLEKDGQAIETEDYPQDPGYKFLSSRLLNPEDVPEATNFSVWQGQEECTQKLLKDHKLLIIVQDSVTVPETVLHKLPALVKNLSSGLQPILISPDEQHQDMANALGLPRYTTTPDLLRAMMHAPMGLLLLQEGVVKGKWHYRDLAQAHKQLRHLRKFL